jgi:hypothetical protein
MKKLFDRLVLCASALQTTKGFQTLCQRIYNNYLIVPAAW